MNELTEELLRYGGKDAGVLKRFMKEFFPFSPLRKAGFFKPEMKGDYYAQAEKVCKWFGFKTVFEYGATEITCHITYAEGKRPDGEGLITVYPNIYES